MECWNRPVSCIFVKCRSRTLGTECGDIFAFVNINYILSFVFIDAIVHCNVPDIWNSALLACVVSGAPMVPILRVSLEVRVSHGGVIRCGLAKQ